MRPYGSAFIYLGWDEHNGFQIFTSDPSGNIASWRAISQGVNEDAINNALQEKYQEILPRDQALGLLIKSIYSNEEQSPPESNKVIIGFLEKDLEGDLAIEYLSISQKNDLIKSNGPSK